jgi:hypothetical protein
MKSILSYKNCLVRGESFQLAQSCNWIPRYSLTLQGANNNSHGALSHHDRLDQVFRTENEADEFALKDAMRWIDQNCLSE